MIKGLQLFIIVFLCFSQLYGQVSKKPVTPAKPATKTNVVVMAEINTDSLNEALGDSLMAYMNDTSTTPRYFLFPQFYSYWPIKKGDTVIKYQCYDAENSYINVDTLHNINDVQHIHFVKAFTNYLHTFIDVDGRPKPSTASKIIYKYDETDSDTWKSYDYASKYIGELKEFKSDIVRCDTTTIVHPVNKSRQLVIRKYYKVVEQKQKGEIEQD